MHKLLFYATYITQFQFLYPLALNLALNIVVYKYKVAQRDGGEKKKIRFAIYVPKKYLLLLVTQAPCAFLPLKSSSNSILIFLHRQLQRATDRRYSVPFWCYRVSCRRFCCLFYAILSPFVVFYTFLRLFVAKSEICQFLGVRLSKTDKLSFF